MSKPPIAKEIQKLMNRHVSLTKIGIMLGISRQSVFCYKKRYGMSYPQLPQKGALTNVNKGIQ
jgi:hypothetical protein